MANPSVGTNDEQQLSDIAEALDALSTACDLAAFAEQYDKIQQLSRDRDSLATPDRQAPYSPQLLAALTHAVSAGLLLVHQLNPQRVQQLPPAAADCLLCCIDTYSHLVKLGLRARQLSQIRTDIAELGLLPAMTKAAATLKTAAPQIAPATPSAATTTAIVKSSNLKPQPASTSADDVSIAARDQSPDHSEAAAETDTAVQPSFAAAAAVEPSWKLPTSEAILLHPIGMERQLEAAAAAAATAGGTAVADPHQTLSKGLLLLYAHVILALWGAPAPNPLGSEVQEVTAAFAGLAVALLQLYGRTTAPPASAPITATATGAKALEAGTHRAPPLPAAISTSTNSISSWQSDQQLLVCISSFADILTLVSYELCAVGPSEGSNTGDAHALHLSEDVVQIAVWVAASAADALRSHWSSIHFNYSITPTQTVDARRGAAAAARPDIPTAALGSLSADSSDTMLKTLSPGAAVIEQLPWRCKASLEQPGMAILSSTRFILDALLYRSGTVPNVTASPYGVNLSGGPGLHPCKVLQPQIVGPLMAMVTDVLVSQLPCRQTNEIWVTLIILFGKTMWNQADLVPPAVAATAYVSIARPLVCQLLPHVQWLHQGFERTADEYQLESAVAQRLLLNMLLQIVRAAGAQGFPDSVALELADLFRCQPSLTAAALESAVRSEALHLPDWLRDGAAAATVMRLLMHAVYDIPQKQADTGLCEPSAAAPEAARLPAPALAASWGSPNGCGGSLLAAATADPQLARQVFALSITCLKCTKLCSDDLIRPVVTAVATGAVAVSLSTKDDLGVMKYVDLAKDMKGFVLDIVQDLAAAETAGSTNANAAAAAAADLALDLAPSSATNAAALRRWIVLAGRSLCVLGTQLSRGYWHEMASLDDQPASVVLKRLSTAVTAMFWCSNLVQWLGKHIPDIGLQGESSAAEKALHDLLSQQQPLHTKLKDITTRMGSALEIKDHGTAVACVWQFLAGPAQDLHQFGVLVCAELPVAGCCSNLECQSVTMRGELLTQHRCSSCKVVRYCGVDCQRQHWKQHKPVCARFKASNK